MIPRGLDAQIEPLTQALVDLTLDGSTIAEARLAASQVEAVFLGDPTSLTIVLAGSPPEGLWDAQLLLLTGIGYEPEEDSGSDGNLALELDLDDGDAWDEQSLRELATQTLGILYYVYEEKDTGGYHLEIE